MNKRTFDNSTRSAANPAEKVETAPSILPPPHTAWMDVVKENVRQLRFGVVQIIVHDAKVVQIERTERTRLDLSRALADG
jgi:hypothetical protein